MNQGHFIASFIFLQICTVAINIILSPLDIISQSKLRSFHVCRTYFRKTPIFTNFDKFEFATFFSILQPKNKFSSLTSVRILTVD